MKENKLDQYVEFIAIFKKSSFILDNFDLE
jgi:hypothetical protein